MSFLRFIVVAGVTAIAAVSTAAYFGLIPRLNPYVEQARAAVRVGEIELVGNLFVTRAEVESHLPPTRSGLWWRVNGTAIARGLESAELVRKAEVSPCTRLSLTCFRITIEERLPRYAALVNSEMWLVGEDGVFMGRVPEDTILRDGAGAVVEPPIVLKGLDRAEASPDAIRARLDRVGESIRLIEQEVPFKVADAALVSGEDLAVRFRDIPYPVVFEIGEPDRFKVEVGRFVQLLKELDGKHHLVSTIDLAFDRLAVVKLKKQ